MTSFDIGRPSDRAAASKNATLGLPIVTACFPEAYSKRRHERTGVEHEAICRLPVPVPLDRQQLGASEQLPKGPVQKIERPRRTDVADNDGARRSLIDPEFVEVGTPSILDVQGHRAYLSLTKPCCRGHRRRYQVFSLDIDPKLPQPLDESAPRLTCRVGGKSDTKPRGTQSVDDRRCSGDHRLTGVHRAIQVEHHALDIPEIVVTHVGRTCPARPLRTALAGRER